MKKRSSIIHGDMAIQWASTVISYVHDAEGLPLCEQLDYYCIDYLNKAVLPHKKTILHDYIEAVIIDSYSYMLDKHFPGEVIADLDECSEYYQLPIDSLGKRQFRFDSTGELLSGDFEDAEVYADNFLNLFQEKLLSTLAEDVFTILYSDKNLLAFFCNELAEKRRNLKASEYPDILASDGVLQRCQYWPAWLERGIYMRDKGRCQLCGCDVSGILRTDVKYNIDHIVPLKCGGINDPINLQLSCEHCNKSKGARSTKFNNIASPFWRLDEYEQL